METTYKRKRTLNPEQIQEFVDWMRLKTDKSERCIDQYRHGLLRILKDCGSIDKKSVEKWRDTSFGKYSARTISVTIIGYNCWAVKFKRKIDWQVKNIKIQRQLFIDNIPTETEVNKLLDGLKNDGNIRHYFLIKLLAQTGARVSEIIKFKLEDCASCSVSIISKGMKNRTIFIPKATAQEVASYYKQTEQRETGYIFPSTANDPRYNGGMMSTRGVSAVIRYAGEKYGVRKEVCHPHAFRHYFAKKFLKASKNNITMLADILGHNDINTTAIYLRMSENEMKRKFNNMVNW